jgi:hypothetical protein
MSVFAPFRKWEWKERARPARLKKQQEKEREESGDYSLIGSLVAVAGTSGRPECRIIPVSSMK